ncbi:hypothetical protein M9Y10_004157 [Tritrichomonas musculus]|uniref:DUF3447 domain-containing protein n=1 Tax=Tritrichomonas musculus TaxID=1915356 RepID=A0ABR2JSL7_9EUKA
MEIHEYVDQMKEIYDSLLEIIGNDDINDIDSAYQNFYYLIDSRQIKNDSEELGELLKLISKISNNHQRNRNFISKIEKILINFSEQIKQSFSNFEIFQFFRKNKLILLSLFEHKIITVDDNIFEAIMSEKDNVKQTNEKTLLELVEAMDDDDFNEDQNNDEENKIQQFHYRMYFYPEIKNFLSEEQKKAIEEEINNHDETILNNFEEKRKKGENDSYICELIRNDSIELFVAYCTRTNCSLNSKIKTSIFETNLFLIKNEPTLIEYAAFFGSIQIFQYLKFNKVELKSSLWLYAIHSNNPELIHLLEENKIEPPEKSYSKVLKESIKCHHNNIANYIKSNLINESDNVYQIDGNYYGNIYSNSFQSHNYDFINEFINDKYVFFYLCEFNYIKLVRLFLADENIEINCQIIKTVIFFK